MKRVLLVDDEKSSVIYKFLSKDGLPLDIVGEAVKRQGGFDKTNTLKPDIVFMVHRNAMDERTAGHGSD